MVLESTNLSNKTLQGQTALVSGAGRGIGFETSKALLWLGANVILAEIDEHNGHAAEENLSREFGKEKVLFYPVDIGKEEDICSLKQVALAKFGKVDIVINNAAVTPMGTVIDCPIAEWDRSYQVNLRGPVLLAQHFLPEMIKRDYGVFICVFSVGDAFMGAYESFKTAQVHLANTLDAELEGKNVHAFSIGPGFVDTPGLQEALKTLAPLYGMSIQEFYALNAEHLISVAEAGAGFAAAAALAEKYRGQEISSKQALIEAGAKFETVKSSSRQPDKGNLKKSAEICSRVYRTLQEQSAGWKERNLFERQWMLRDFKKNAGAPVENWLEFLEKLKTKLEEPDSLFSEEDLKYPLECLSAYYRHMQDLAAGYEKDPQKLQEYQAHIQTWIDEVEELKSSLNF